MYIDVKIEELYPEHQHSWPHLEDPVSSFLSPECPAADCRHREQISGDLTGGSLPSCRALGPRCPGHTARGGYLHRFSDRAI